MVIRIHNRRGTPEYSAWSRAFQSCYNEKSPNYKSVGGAGIKMCEEWKNDCVAFMDYISPKPAGKFYLQRIDRSKDFEPGNVEWSPVLYRPERGEHRLSMSSEYNIWTKIKSRCYRVDDPVFERYGGRGILMCDAWKNDFMSFYNYVGPRPSKIHSIDRIDNNKGYEPGNVRWATAFEQTRNKRSNIHVQICCQTKILEDWCRIHGVTRRAFSYRTAKGWDTLAAFGLRPSPK
jgi:hypothetical protein